MRGEGGVQQTYMCAQSHIDWNLQKEHACIHANAHIDTSENFPGFQVLVNAKI